MNEMLGWYGYDTARKDNMKIAPYRSHSNSTSSGSDSPKYTGRITNMKFVGAHTKCIHFILVFNFKLLVR